MTLLVAPPRPEPTDWKDAVEEDPPPRVLAQPAPEGLLRRVLQDRDALLGEIAAGKEVSLRGVAAAGLGMMALAGLSLGVWNGAPQALSAAIKTPLVTLGAVAICFPAFFIFASLQGSRVTITQALRSFAVGIGLRGAVVAALAPLLLFFACVGSPYGLMLLLAGLVFGLGDAMFLRTVDQFARAARKQGDKLSAGLVRAWMVAYMVVATQLAWSLRPFIGVEVDAAGQHVFRLIGGPGDNMLLHFFGHVARMFGG